MIESMAVWVTTSLDRGSLEMRRDRILEEGTGVELESYRDCNGVEFYLLLSVGSCSPPYGDWREIKGVNSISLVKGL